MLGGAPVIYDINPHETHDTVMHQFGAVGMDKWGDVYRYVKAGSSNISAGKLQAAPAPKTNHHNMAAASAVTADGLTKKVTVTLGATAATANEYAGGLLVANDVSPEGEAYRVLSHPAANSGATLEVEVASPFITDITTSSEFSLMHNTYNGVVEVAVEERDFGGIPIVDISSGEYGWVKSRGITPALAGASIDLGAELTSHASTAGAVDAMNDTAATRVDYVYVGQAVVAGVSGEYRPIKIDLD